MKEKEPAPDKDKAAPAAPGCLSDMIAGLVDKLGTAEIEEAGRKVKADKGEIHVIENDKEIHIGKAGIRIRKVNKDEGTPKT